METQAVGMTRIVWGEESVIEKPVPANTAGLDVNVAL